MRKIKNMAAAFCLGLAALSLSSCQDTKVEDTGPIAGTGYWITDRNLDIMNNRMMRIWDLGSRIRIREDVKNRIAQYSKKNHQGPPNCLNVIWWSKDSPCGEMPLTVINSPDPDDEVREYYCLLAITSMDFEVYRNRTKPEWKCENYRKRLYLTEGLTNSNKLQTRIKLNQPEI